MHAVNKYFKMQWVLLLFQNLSYKTNVPMYKMLAVSVQPSPRLARLICITPKILSTDRSLSAGENRCKNHIIKCGKCSDL